MLTNKREETGSFVFSLLLPYGILRIKKSFNAFDDPGRENKFLMIKSKTMNSIIKAILAFVASGIIVSCNNDSTTTSKENTTDTSSSQTTNTSPQSTSVENTTKTNDLMNPMSSMMDRMKAMKMTADFDIDFANMMIEHHQAAIDMSEQELSSGKDDKIKSMAQNIITSQKEEIIKLRDFVKSYKPSGMKHGEGELQKSMSDMESKMKTMQMTGDMDKDFAMMMIDHHESAVAMSKKQLTNGMSDKLKQMARKVITDQNKEIKEFKSWLDSKK